MITVVKVFKDCLNYKFKNKTEQEHVYHLSLITLWKTLDRLGMSSASSPPLLSSTRVAALSSWEND